jgi:hypothetical protein
VVHFLARESVCSEKAPPVPVPGGAFWQGRRLEMVTDFEDRIDSYRRALLKVGDYL